MPEMFFFRKSLFQETDLFLITWFCRGYHHHHHHHHHLHQACSLRLWSSALWYRVFRCICYWGFGGSRCLHLHGRSHCYTCKDTQNKKYPKSIKKLKSYLDVGSESRSTLTYCELWKFRKGTGSGRSEVKWVSEVKWSEVSKWSEVRWVSKVKWVALKLLGTKVPCTLEWPYTEVTWLYCDYFIWCVSCTVVVLTCFVICVCVCVCVCVWVL